MFEFIRSLLGVIFGLAMIYLFVQACAWSPVVYQALNEARKDPKHEGKEKAIVLTLWALSAIWYGISVLVFFFTGLWVIASVLQAARDWWHSPNR